jgi:tetratricopeptide (TPR) repeat protein/predicted Ser/Thr protein kinase
MGRYVVVSTLGVGGMGVVVAAYDPELDRKAALKLLRPRGARSAAAHARLAREAQALAKLNHPNVVTVYDVGEYEGQVFVAMEFVRGTTLRAWLDAQPRSWSDVVRVFAAAGRGLAAAHEVGLVHRDFKPDNVMIDDAERVRVMDFGLARAFDESTLDGAEPKSDVDAARMQLDAELDSSSSRVTPLHEPLTRTGTLLGTPAYMAPEQWLRLEVSPHCDQFSFCVALYEALYGRRPFAGDTLEARGRAVVRGELSPPPRASAVPSHVRAVVLRGLARNPIARHTSMQSLLDALVDDPRVRLRRRGVVSLIAALSLAAGWGVWSASRREATIEPCGGAQARLDQVWSPARREALHEAIAATKLPYASDTATRVEQRLDGYATQWASVHRDACMAHQRGEQSGELLDLRMRCLDERLQHVEATLTILSDANAEVVGNAVEAVAGLPSLARCSDERALRAELPPPDDVELAQRVASLDEQLIAAETLRRTGEFERGLALARTILDAARELDYEPLHVRAWLVAGKLADAQASYGEAETLLERAYASALALGLRSEAAEAAAMLVQVVGERQAKHEVARGWAKSAEPLARAAATPEASARYLYTLGNLAKAEGKYAEARADLAQALAIREDTLGPDHPDVATALHSLGTIEDYEGNYPTAQAYFERALAIRERALGPDHPEVASALGSLGNVAYAQGEQARARAYYERALAIREAALGPEHPSVANSLNNLGVVADVQGRHADAQRYFERSLAIRERTLGPEHPTVAASLINLGSVARIQGRHAAARADLERALAIREKALGPAHPNVAIALTALGLVATDEGRLADARAAHERALAIREAALGPDHVDVGLSLVNLGNVALAEHDAARALVEHERARVILVRALGPDHLELAFALTGRGEASLALGKPDEALPELERALELRTTHEGDITELARTRFALARALRLASARPTDHERARLLAEQAALALEATGNHSNATLVAIREWLGR